MKRNAKQTTATLVNLTQLMISLIESQEDPQSDGLYEYTFACVVDNSIAAIQFVDRTQATTTKDAIDHLHTDAEGGKTTVRIVVKWASGTASPMAWGLAGVTSSLDSLFVNLV